MERSRPPIEGRVLDVQDSPEIHDLVQDFFKSGFAISPESILHIQSAPIEPLIENHKLDPKTLGFVVCGHRLNHGTGIEVVQALRQAGAECPILVMSASSDKNLPKEYEEAGADAFMTMPFDVGELEIVVERLLTKRHQEQAKQL